VEGGGAGLPGVVGTVNKTCEKFVIFRVYSNRKGGTACQRRGISGQSGSVFPGEVGFIRILVSLHKP
jgi:hypothetical protein